MGAWKTALMAGTAVAAMGLAGCNSDGVGTASNLPPTKVTPNDNPQYAQDAGDTANESLDAGTELASNNTTASEVDGTYDPNNPGTTSGKDESFSIKKNANGDVVVTVNGAPQTYTSADLAGDIDPNAGKTEANSDGYEVTNTDANGNFTSGHSIYTWTADNLDDLANNTNVATKYAQTWNYFWSDATSAKVGYAVVGTETDPANLPATATATYKGGAHADSYAADGTLNERTRIRGDLTMTADFGAKTMSGTVDNLTRETRVNGVNSGRQAAAGSINLAETAIKGNGYAGAVTLDSAAQTALDVKTTTGSTYSGRFYGPAADETAGVFKLSTTDHTGGSYVGTGSFAATKQ